MLGSKSAVWDKLRFSTADDWLIEFKKQTGAEIRVHTHDDHYRIHCGEWTAHDIKVKFDSLLSDHFVFTNDSEPYFTMNPSTFKDICVIDIRRNYASSC